MLLFIIELSLIKYEGCEIFGGYFVNSFHLFLYVMWGYVGF